MTTLKRIDVSILIVSYNTRALTLAALDSIVAETKDVSYEIIVVDNASTDGSAAAITAHPAKPKLIKLKEVYEALEETTDRCEDVADVLQNVVVKNS